MSGKPVGASTNAACSPWRLVDMWWMTRKPRLQDFERGKPAAKRSRPDESADFASLFADGDVT